MNSIDFQDWELLSNDGFLDDGGSKNQSTRVYPEMHNQLAHEPMSSGLQENNDTAPSEGEVDTVTQVFFKKMKETEFVDNKVDCPSSSRRGFHFEEKGKRRGNSKADLEERRDRFNIWKLSLFGVAAAGACIIISWGNSNKQHQHNQKHHRRA